MTDKVQTRITVDDLLKRNEDEAVEVVNGEYVKTTMSAANYMHVVVIDNLYDILKPFVKKHKFGYVHTDGVHFVIRKNPDGSVDQSRIPDLFFLRRASNPADFDFKSVFPGAPDLVVEVVSPSKSDDILAEKRRDYFEAGAEEFWVLKPEGRKVYRYQRDNADSPHEYINEDSFIAESLFPGLTITVRDLFTVDEA